jgi:hypothetical protein
LNVEPARVRGRTGRPSWRCCARHQTSPCSYPQLSGQTERQNPIYKKRFSEIIAELPPIGSNPKTAEHYRADLLNISHEGEKFDAWYLKERPRVSNPRSMRDAYQEARKPKDEQPQPSKPPQHQIELAGVQEEGATKIADLTKELNFLKGDNVEAALQRTADWPQVREHELILQMTARWTPEQIHQLIAYLERQAPGRSQQVN